MQLVICVFSYGPEKAPITILLIFWHYWTLADSWDKSGLMRNSRLGNSQARCVHSARTWSLVKSNTSLLVGQRRKFWTATSCPPPSKFLGFRRACLLLARSCHGNRSETYHFDYCRPTLFSLLGNSPGAFLRKLWRLFQWSAEDDRLGF